MYIYTIKDNDEPATGDVLAFLEANATKAIVTYDVGNVNGIHHTGGICHRGGHHRGAARNSFAHLSHGVAPAFCI